jgi:hypothetical protein
MEEIRNTYKILVGRPEGKRPLPRPRRKKVKKKSKAVSLHAMEAHGGRGGIAPTH